jgi:hypothetical protein
MSEDSTFNRQAVWLWQTESSKASIAYSSEDVSVGYYSSNRKRRAFWLFDFLCGNKHQPLALGAKEPSASAKQVASVDHRLEPAPLFGLKLEGSRRREFNKMSLDER